MTVGVWTVHKNKEKPNHQKPNDKKKELIDTYGLIDEVFFSAQTLEEGHRGIHVLLGRVELRLGVQLVCPPNVHADVRGRGERGSG